VAKTTTAAPKPGESSGSRPLSRAKATAASGGRGGGDLAARRQNMPSILTFFQEARAELRKVTWPTRQEAMNLTVAVVAMTVGISAFLGIIDTLLDYLIKPLIGAQ